MGSQHSTKAGFLPGTFAGGHLIQEQGEINVSAALAAFGLAS